MIVASTAHRRSSSAEKGCPVFSTQTRPTRRRPPEGGRSLMHHGSFQRSRDRRCRFHRTASGSSLNDPSDRRDSASGCRSAPSAGMRSGNHVVRGPNDLAASHSADGDPSSSSLMPRHSRAGTEERFRHAMAVAQQALLDADRHPPRLGWRRIDRTHASNGQRCGQQQVFSRTLHAYLRGHARMGDRSTGTVARSI